MINVVLQHDPVTDHLEWSPCEYFGISIGVFFSVSTIICHAQGLLGPTPVAECPPSHPFLSAFDVFEFCIVGGLKAEKHSCIVVHFQCEGGEEGEVPSHFLYHIG